MDNKNFSEGLGHATWIDGRLNGESTGHRVHLFSKGGGGVTQGPVGAGQQYADQLIKTPGNLNKDSNNLQAFRDNPTWEQSSGLPNVNGHTSRPTIVGLSEKELLPAWITNPNND